jgi:phosphosulfolactate synthase (CoM biosynthesis protein A)
MLEDNNFDDFAKRCTELSAEFYLPIADNMIVVSEQKLKEIVAEVATKALAPFDDLIKTMGEITL